ncbi:solute carrier family 15 member 2-like [Tachyglossus aculeatus]|uniref:solute carrier family 15 member 2-like n=1 Tax=Tachyglossus aculeatus TaxID=9261 RepID=UPI0018F4A677|nr:solute carrier family 15 member 2-like [Tachyglossus aculeatus]
METMEQEQFVKKPSWVEINYLLKVTCILISVFTERSAFFGMNVLLTLYFVKFHHWDENLSTAIYHAFMGSCYLFTIVGAIVADSWLGKYKATVVWYILYLLGFIFLLLSSLPFSWGQALPKLLIGAGLTLIAFGVGGIKPCTTAFFGDQFQEGHVEVRRQFFAILYFLINLGVLISMCVTPLLTKDFECFGKDCYGLAFGASGGILLFSFVIFVSGQSRYVKSPPEGNMLVKVCKCIQVCVSTETVVASGAGTPNLWLPRGAGGHVRGHARGRAVLPFSPSLGSTCQEFALSNRLRNRSSQIPKREHWLDWATEKYPMQLIVEVKALMRMLVLYIPLPMFWALFDQQGSRWTLQATRMDGNVGLFVIRPDQVQILNPFMILILVPMFELGIYPLVKLCKINLTPIRKMVIGMVLAALAFMLAAAIEIQMHEITEEMPLESRKSYVQILNLARNEVLVTMEQGGQDSLISEPIGAFQKSSYYYKLHLEEEHQNLRFVVESQGATTDKYYDITERMWYSLVIYTAGTNISNLLLEEMSTKPANGLAAVRFVNTMKRDIYIFLGSGDTLRVGKNYKFSDYQTLDRGEYNQVRCKTWSGACTLDLGLLDFGAVYTVFILWSSRSNLRVWKINTIPPNHLSMLWQVPQYVLITAGEVMFCVTSFDFSYAEAPASMKSVLQSIAMMTVALGNVIVLIIAEVGHLVQWAEFLLFACLLLGVCIVFSIMGYYYVPWAKAQQIVREEQEQQAKQEKQQQQWEQQQKRQWEQQQQRRPLIMVGPLPAFPHPAEDTGSDTGPGKSHWERIETLDVAVPPSNAQAPALHTHLWVVAP